MAYGMFVYVQMCVRGVCAHNSAPGTVCVCVCVLKHRSDMSIHLSSDDCYFRDGCLCISIQELCSLADDASILLVSA